MTPSPGGPLRAPIERLACGRDAAAVWDRAEARAAPDDHERRCPHCAAVFADAAALHPLVHRMAAQTLDPPSAVLDRVLGEVSSAGRPQEVLALPSPYGPARMNRPAAAAVLRHAVDRMTGVRARSCRIEQPDAGGAPHATTVTITVAARFGVELASVTARVRRLVVAAGEQALGVPVTRVDIEVVDVFEDGAP